MEDDSPQKRRLLLGGDQKHLQIEKESRSRDKVVEESNDRTNKANMVSKPNRFKGKNNNSGIMLGSVGTEMTKNGLQ